MFKSLLGKKTSTQGIVALCFTSDGISIAISDYTKNQKQSLTHCEFIATNKKQLTLKQLTDKYNLDHYDCHLVLATDDYRLISIEAPPVADNELAEAIRWKITELVDFPTTDAVLDYYQMPSSNRANSKKMIEVVATPQSTIQPLVDLCLNCNLQIKVIDIQEMTLRNLATLLPENERGIAVLHIQKVTGHILIEQQDIIYLSRKLATGFDHLGLNDVNLNKEQIALEQNGLALEIQRSIDYVESFYTIPPTSELAVIPLPENTQGLLNMLNNNHGITARVMDLSTIIDGNILLDDSTQSHCATVIGATLRNTPEETL